MVPAINFIQATHVPIHNAHKSQESVLILGQFIMTYSVSSGVQYRLGLKDEVIRLSANV